MNEAQVTPDPTSSVLVSEAADQPVWIMEGAAGAHCPDAVWVEQGDKAYFFVGAPTALQESIGSKSIVESIDDLVIERDSRNNVVVKDGRWFIEGVFQEADSKNINGRIYPLPLWERLLQEKSDVVSRINAGSMLGHVEHPEDGRTDLNKGALVVRYAKLCDDKKIRGKAELLDTTEGRRLQEYAVKGVRFGVSSRGRGIVKADGVIDVSKPFHLETWDAVHSPSVRTAYPTPAKVSESGENGLSKSESPDDVELTAFLESVEVVTDVAKLNELIGKFSSSATSPARRAALSVACMQRDVYADMKARMLVESADPSAPAVDDTRKYRRTIKRLRRELEERDTRIASLNAANDRLVESVACAEIKHAQQERKVKALTEALSTKSQKRVDESPVWTKADELVEANPQLSSIRDLLRRADSVESLEEMVKSFLADSAVVAEDENEETEGEPQQQPIQVPVRRTSPVMEGLDSTGVKVVKTRRQLGSQIGSTVSKLVARLG